ncbi:MAG: hypothetical protein AUJ75_02650 [Candidatus Omnitrophica bacterium CG1_02_49_10]|nr:MAG: hypothetical protein AUJ75_02650 [Candidatus Omnitrophica bacterium CG1_02_49_10]
MAGKKILIIDDDADIRDIIRHFLEGEGYRVHECSSSAEAVKEAESYKPDLITLDVLMPGIDGFQVHSLLKANPSTSRIPIVVVSILGDEGKFRGGISAFICKPFEKQELISVVSTVLNKTDDTKGGAVKKILIVDDEPDIVDIVKIYMQSAGYETCEACDGIEAIEKVRKELPDLIVLDVKMPHMDGYEVIKVLKKDERYGKIPIVILTATKRQGTDKDTFLRLGASGYIAKPFTEESLLSEIRAILARTG